MTDAPPNIITDPELTDCMEGFGLQASQEIQRETWKEFVSGWLPPSVVHALGLRETGLRNICGGAVEINGVWVPTKTDRGVFQISDEIPTNAAWLYSEPGCPDGSWRPDMAGWHAKKVSALTPGRVPTLSAALEFTLSEFRQVRSLASAAGVSGANLLQFSVAAHNAGFQGALDGYKNGNVDENTTLGNYSAWVMYEAPIVETWLKEHPNWLWVPPKQESRLRRVVTFGRHGTHH